MTNQGNIPEAHEHTDVHRFCTGAYSSFVNAGINYELLSDIDVKDLFAMRYCDPQSLWLGLRTYEKGFRDWFGEDFDNLDAALSEIVPVEFLEKAQDAEFRAVILRNCADPAVSPLRSELYADLLGLPGVINVNERYIVNAEFDGEGLALYVTRKKAKVLSALVGQTHAPSGRRITSIETVCA